MYFHSHGQQQQISTGVEKKAKSVTAPVEVIIMVQQPYAEHAPWQVVMLCCTARRIELAYHDPWAPWGTGLCVYVCAHSSYSLQTLISVSGHMR